MGEFRNNHEELSVITTDKMMEIPYCNGEFEFYSNF
jgi:hypothetical protein